MNEKELQIKLNNSYRNGLIEYGITFSYLTAVITANYMKNDYFYLFASLTLLCVLSILKRLWGELPDLEGTKFDHYIAKPFFLICMIAILYRDDILAFFSRFGH
ncbi:hypothetical protein SAMN05444392_108101 [Seinonella peptonophila]|uniref:Uncharacterized protein n=1 Tax=Seinonella peptonophila TaxID=112248 RepID=A0A1M4Z8N7_9BACL|nr:hypothetical protein [Seinonella peptonophila]SHF14308.1 hypothetical protein SAMN05444392_108101 [Seinonella peptonophila]